MAKSKEVIEAQLEIINGYYIKIAHNENITVQEIFEMLQCDRDWMKGEVAVYEAEQIINNKDNSKQSDGI